MRVQRRGFAQNVAPPLVAACILLPALGSSAHAAARMYWSAIHATVLAVDRRHKAVTIRYEALETVPPGVRLCAVRDPRELRALHAGETIEARAETSHAEWLLDDIHVVARPESVHSSGARMAVRARVSAR